MPKKPSVTIEIYSGRRGDFRYRFISKNGENMQHSYDRKISATRTVNKIVTAIQNGDFEVVDKTTPTRSAVARRT